MIDPALSPTRLVHPGERPPVVIAQPARPSRLRNVRAAAALVWLLVRLLARQWTGRASARTTAIRLRSTFEALGGLWIRAGQLLSLRIDLFPAEVCEELARLRDRNVGFPSAEARAILEQELGGPVERFFDEFDDVPFAVQSIAQVHRAKLRREGRYVAVKVRQPHIAALFARDLALIRRVVRAIELVRFRPHLHWEFAFDELREVASQELNFQYEASAIRRMRRRLRGQKVYVPKVFGRYVTRGVIVTEFIHAALMADVIALDRADPARVEAWVAANNIDPRLVARRLIDSIFRQILEHNLYHGDLSPGHLVLLRDSRIALIDFTMTTFTEREYLEKYRLFVKALAGRDYAKAADMALMLCASLPNLDMEEVKEQLVRSLRQWATRTLVKELPYREKSIDNATIGVVDVLARYGCTMDWEWLRIRRALVTLDRSLERLYPDVNYPRVLQKYFEEAERRRLRALVGPPLVRRTIGGYLTALDIQDRINEYTMFQGTLVRRHAQVFQGATNKVAAIFAAMTAQLTFAVAVVAVLAFVVLLEQRYPAEVRRLMGPQLAGFAATVPRLDAAVWALVFAVLAYGYLTLRHLTARLRQKDVRPHERVAAV